MTCLGKVLRPSACLNRVPRPSAMTCLGKVPRPSPLPNKGASAEFHDMLRQGASA